ncbi:hypothetical protein B0H13DRAFT_1715703, partial [Mycena leptocephala]
MPGPNDSWGTRLSLHDRPSSPHIQKPQSPPQMFMPDTGGNPSFNFAPPMINAPEGDGLGPRLHIVPATPVDGGAVSTAVPFQTSPEALQWQASRTQPLNNEFYFDPPNSAGLANDFLSPNSVFSQIHPSSPERRLKRRSKSDGSQPTSVVPRRGWGSRNHSFQRPRPYPATHYVSAQ